MCVSKQDARGSGTTALDSKISGAFLAVSKTGMGKSFRPLLFGLSCGEQTMKRMKDDDVITAGNY